MYHNSPRYLSYLLRLWRVRERRGWQWRSSIESPGSGERYTFPDLASLIAFLRDQTTDHELDRQADKPDISIEDE